MKRRRASHHWVRFVAATALAFVAVAIPASGEPATLVAVVAPSLDAQVSQVRPSTDGQRVLLGGSFGLVSVDVAQRDVTAIAPSSTGLAGFQAWAQSPTGATVVWASSASGSPMYETMIGASTTRLRLSSSFTANGVGRGPAILDVYGMAVSATGQVYAFVHMVGAYADSNIASDAVLSALPRSTGWDLVPDPFSATIQTAYSAETATSPTQNTFATCRTLRQSNAPQASTENDRFLLTVYAVVPQLRVTAATVSLVQPFNSNSPGSPPYTECTAVDAGYAALVPSFGPQSGKFVVVAGHGQTRRVALGRYRTFIGLSPNGQIVASADGDRLALTDVSSRRQQVLVAPGRTSVEGQLAWSADDRHLILNDQWVINVATDQWTKVCLPSVTSTTTGYDACFTADNRAVVEVEEGGSSRAEEQLYVASTAGKSFAGVTGSGSLSPYQSSSLCAPGGSQARFYFAAGQPPSLYSGNAASLDGSPFTHGPTGTTGPTG